MKNNQMNKKGNKVGKFFKKLLKKVIRTIVFFIIGFAYTIYLIIKSFNDMAASLFMKIPRILRVTIIYCLVFVYASNCYECFKPLELEMVNKINVSNFESSVIIEEKPIEAEIKPIDEKKEQKCIFDSTSCLIYENGVKMGLKEEEILISIAISKWETGNYTSQAFKNKNNVGGMMCKNGLIKYNSLEEGINAFLKNLKNNYFGIGLNTLEKIQPKYCPIGAKNDPKGLNKNWLGGTNKMLKELKEAGK